MTSIYVGNLPYKITEDELRDAFAAYGEVTSAKIIIDRDTAPRVSPSSRCPTRRQPTKPSRG